MAEAGSDFLSQIRGFNTKSLNNVDTEITTVEGRKFVEKHKDGETMLQEVGDGPVTLGFCPDYKADLNVGEAMEGVLIGSQDVAHDRGKLKELGVTHILNVAYGVANAFPDEFECLTQEMYDDNEETLLNHYLKCEAFIDKARESQGTVLVHCNAGRSRSSSIALAYVLHKKRIPLLKALEHLRKTRPRVEPNQNFMKQLLELEKNLGIA